ncbi:MAG: type II secretory pathway, component PulD [Verrucomicrobia bacterium]|nr:type II secretory pathway, component PulD [Verrucomicrobiota bacterium]
MKHRPLLTPLAVLFSAALIGLAMPAGRALAQNQTDAKIRLMSEALRARDAGDLDKAEKVLAELTALAPNDPSVARLKTELEAQRAALSEAAQRAQAAATARAEEQRLAAIRAEEQRAAAAKAPPAAAPVMVDVKIPEPGQTPPAPPPPAGPTPEPEAEALARAESARLTNLMVGAQTMLATARTQVSAGKSDDAIATVDAALASLPSNPLTQKLIADLKKEKASALLDKSQALLRRGDTDGARAALAAYNDLAPGDARTAGVAQKITAAATTKAVAGADSAFANERAATTQLVAKARAQYLAGDIDGAQATFREIEAKEPDNTVAKGFLLRIANEKAETGALNREKTRAQLLEEVAKGWQRPGIYQERARGTDQAAAVAPLAKKLTDIILPSVSFTRAEIGQVVTALSAASEEFDVTGTGPKGVNIVLLDPSNKNPTVTISLRNSSLKRVLDFVTEAVGYQFEVQADAVVVRPGGETSTLDTAFFPITRATVLRMTGVSGPPSGPAAGGPAGRSDPYAAGGGAGGGGPEGGASSGEAAGMKAFLQQAGVSFTVEGTSLAYDGSAIIVTQTGRNMERIRNILARYNDVRQVEIESKFMEVQEGALEELGVTWNMSRRGVPQINPTTGAPVLDSNGRQVFVPQETYTSAGVTRSLATGFPSTSNSTAINIRDLANTANDIAIPVAPTQIPGGVQLAATAAALGNITGFVGEFDVSAVVRALSQKQGTDLLSSPKITVLSGNPANITVAQELRYPQSYGEIQSQVGSGAAAGATGISAAGVTITAGTPQEFTSRNVGVELKVTPTVEEDDYSISLDLNPKVTEFEGFVEYGGPSVAISSGVTVTVPPGFYQPIFSVRDITTKVTIWDGATLVMGGLTREEVKKVDDKVPFFGDLPIIGRLFRSKGQSAQKRNLLIFVTANLVSPGGSPKKQSLKSTPANSLFQNPTIVTPASAEPRTRSGDK